MAELLQAENDWEELMKARNGGTEQMSSTIVDEVRMNLFQQKSDLSLCKLCKYEEKIGMKEMFLKHGVPQPELFLAARPPWSLQKNSDWQSWIYLWAQFLALSSFFSIR